MEYLFQQYQSPMGKVKLKAVAEQGYGLDVSIPYGKGKVATRNTGAMKPRPLYQSPMGKVKVKLLMSITKYSSSINSLWER